VQPLVSVIIPSYNHGHYLAATINSVLAQSWRPLEVIVVDDASTDDTPAVLAKLSGKVRSQRLASNSGGPARPRNAAIALAQGTYISVFDSDDLMLPGKLASQVGFLERHPDIPLVFSDFANFYVDGRRERFLGRAHTAFVEMTKLALAPGEYRLPSAEAFETLIADNYVGTSGIVMRRSLVKAVGGFDEALCNSDDRDFLFRVMRRFDVGCLEKVLHLRRIHSANISSRPAALQAREVVYERLRELRNGAALSAVARSRLDRRLAELYFCRGYAERVAGRRALALKYYLKSWSLRKSDVRIVKSAIRALLPIELFRRTNESVPGEESSPDSQNPSLQGNGQ